MCVFFEKVDYILESSTPAESMTIPVGSGEEEKGGGGGTRAKTTNNDIGGRMKIVVTVACCRARARGISWFFFF